MKINVVYMSQVKKAVGVANEILDVDATYTVQELIVEKLCVLHEKLKDIVLDGAGLVHEIILIFVGDEKIQSNIPYKLKDNDVVTIMTPITGG